MIHLLEVFVTPNTPSYLRAQTASPPLLHRSPHRSPLPYSSFVLTNCSNVPSLLVYGVPCMLNLDTHGGTTLFPYGLIFVVGMPVSIHAQSRQRTGPFCRSAAPIAVLPAMHAKAHGPDCEGCLGCRGHPLAALQRGETAECLNGELNAKVGIIYNATLSNAKVAIAEMHQNINDRKLRAQPVAIRERYDAARAVLPILAEALQGHARALASVTVSGISSDEEEARKRLCSDVNENNILVWASDQQSRSLIAILSTANTSSGYKRSKERPLRMPRFRLCLLTSSWARQLPRWHQR